MSDIYHLDSDGRTRSLTRVRCKNEAKELQALLTTNPELLPGDQIRPDDPRRWLLIKREMPVDDPGGGGERWSIDLFLVDQDGMPTFVECKRFLDTRSRREVVGQMLDYAANGPFYWSADQIREYAEQSAKEHGLDLDEDLRRLDPSTGDSVDDLLEAIVQNLREGQVRLVFFLEEAPIELKSIVDFLNRQMERSEVLLVEAKQYEMEGKRLVAPTLFGYSEEARLTKKTRTVTSGSRRKWDETSFFEDARQKLDPAQADALRQLYGLVGSRGLTVKWGRGSRNGSFSIVAPWVSNKSIVTAFSNGDLQLNFGWLHGTSQVVSFRDEYASRASQLFETEFPEDLTERYPSFKVDQWVPKVTGLVALLDGLVADNPPSEAAP